MTPPKQRSRAWLEERRNGIGASDIPILAGLSPWSSPMAVYLEKRGETPPVEETPEMARGNLLEEPVAQWWAADTGRKVRRRHAIAVHPTYPWARASLDRDVVGGQEILEVKTTSERWSEPPEYVVAQVVWQLGVTGARVAHVAALTGDLSLGRWELLPDPDYFADLLVIGEEAWDGIQTGRPPAIDGSEATRLALTRAYPHETEPMRPSTPEWDAVALLLGEAQAEAKYAAEREATIKNAIRAALGQGAGVQGAGYKLSWTKNKDSTVVEWETVAHELGLSDPSAFNVAVAAHTTIKEGPRVLRPWYAKGFLPELEPGEEPPIPLLSPGAPADDLPGDLPF
jgi:putative phage-type endonuclease